MSSGGQIVGGVVGAVVGFLVTWNPYGAFQGAAIGASIGGYLDPPKGPTQEGPRLTDKSVQTSTYGATIPRVYGTCMVAGNVFWLQGDQLTERVRKESSGGKGGGSVSTVKTYTYYATFAIGLCKGPIAGVRRIWVGPDLIYDAGATDLESIISSNQNIENIQIYLGTDDQLPNSLIQADKGAANVPAYRGLAYLVFQDFELTKYGNSLAQAQVKVEVVNNSQTTVVNTYTATSAISTPSGIKSNGGINSYGGANFTYIQSGIVNSIAFSSSGNISISDIADVSGAASRAPMETKNTERYCYYFTQGTVVSYVFPDFTFQNDGNLGLGAANTIARIGNQAIGQTATSTFFYWTEPLLAPFSFTSTVGPISNYGVFNSRFAFFADSGSTLNIYYVNEESQVISYEFIGSIPDATNYGFNEKGIWSIDVSPLVRETVIRQYDENCNLLYEIDGPRLTNDEGIAGFRHDSLLTYNTGDALGSTIGGRCFSIVFDEDAVSLSSIVQSETLLSNIISSGDIIVNDLVDSVSGYRIASAGSIRNGIEPLRGAWPFDVIQDGYKIRYKPRGTSVVASVDIGELGVEQQIQEAREMDSQLPRKVIIKHIDRSRDYDANEQSAQRENVDSVNTLSMDLPVVLTPTEAKRVAEKLLYIYWLERSDFSFTLPPEYHYLQPSDVITVNAVYATYEIRLTTIKYAQNGTLECTGKLNNASVYNSIADTDGGLTPPITIPLPGPSVSVLIDAPIIDETLQNEPGFSSQMTGLTSGWPSGNLFVTNDLGQTWSNLQAFSGKGTFGIVSGLLSVNQGSLIQKGGSITVSLLSGSLESITEEQMLNGKNYAAYGVDGRWEIIRFQNAALNSDGSYTLDTFIRGDRGTEWATGLHQFGDTFVLMDDPDGAWISQASAAIGVQRGYRAITAGYSIDTGETSNFTYQGVNLETYSPSHGKGVRDGSSNLTISWIRRTRIGGEWRSLVDASLGESTEAYEVDIMNGSTVVRTIASTLQSVTYTAAQQTTDFGSPQPSVTVRIYQLSSVVGRGQPLEVTV